MQLDLRRTAAFVAGLAMVAGIAYFLVSDSGAEQPPPPSQGNGSAESPRPTETPSPTTEPPPELNNTGNDFEAIWRSMTEFRDWVYMQDPKVRWLDDIYERSCKCFKAELRIIRLLSKRDWRYNDQGVQVLHVDTVERPAPDLVTIEVTDRHSQQVLVDAEGDIVRRGAGWPPRDRIVGLHRGQDGRWRVDTILNLNQG